MEDGGSGGEHAMTEMRPPIDEQNARAAAIKRIKEKRDFYTHLFTYVVVNAVLITIWAFTGAAFFWPIFPLLGWGIGIVFHALDVYRTPISEEQIEREMEHLR
jgi:hypothetical protein